jgi:SAM-dependent methyltransferase
MNPIECLNFVFTNFLVPSRRFDSSVVEKMDLPQAVSRELEVDLENLQHLNRNFGAYSLVRYFLRRWLHSASAVSLIDLCTGYGDIPRFIVDWCRKNNVHVHVSAVDFQPATLELATRRSKSYPEISFIVSDIFDFAPATPADFLFCSLALHHFTNDAVIRLLQRVRTMAKQGILIADLERSDLGIVGIFSLTACSYREPMTRHDARLSIQRAFSFTEMHEIAAKAGWRGFGHRRFPVCRQAIWLES